MLSRLSLYVNANAEEMHDHLASHKDNEKLAVKRDGNQFVTDWADIIDDLNKQIDGKLKDATIRDWLTPPPIFRRRHQWTWSLLAYLRCLSCPGISTVKRCQYNTRKDQGGLGQTESKAGSLTDLRYEGSEYVVQAPSSDFYQFIGAFDVRIELEVFGTT